MSEKLSIVIPYKTEVHNGEELKYTLRSIEKNLTGWKNLVIIGTPPTWFNGLNYVECEDIPGRKEYSCYRKLLKACSLEYVSENFGYWNDDHWLLKPLNISEIKNWHNGPLGDEIGKPHSARWRNAAINTIDKLGCANVLNYDIHAPMIFNKTSFIEAFVSEVVELAIKSYYIRFSDYLQYGNGEFMEDCNISSGLTYEEIKKEIEGKLFCSSKGGITKEYFRVLQELFPEKSKFEL